MYLIPVFAIEGPIFVCRGLILRHSVICGNENSKLNSTSRKRKNKDHESGDFVGFFLR